MEKDNNFKYIKTILESSVDGTVTLYNSTHYPYRDDLDFMHVSHLIDPVYIHHPNHYTGIVVAVSVYEDYIPDHNLMITYGVDSGNTRWSTRSCYSVSTMNRDSLNELIENRICDIEKERQNLAVKLSIYQNMLNM